MLKEESHSRRSDAHSVGKTILKVGNRVADSKFPQYAPRARRLAEALLSHYDDDNDDFSGARWTIDQGLDELGRGNILPPPPSSAPSLPASLFDNTQEAPMQRKHGAVESTERPTESLRLILYSFRNAPRLRFRRSLVATMEVLATYPPINQITAITNPLLDHLCEEREILRLCNQLIDWYCDAVRYFTESGGCRGTCP